MFQAKTADYNLRNALRAGIPQVWRVSRYADDIKVGHRVYLWEAGGGGILAQARIIGPVDDIAVPDSQVAFIVAPTRAEKLMKFPPGPYVPLAIDRSVLPYGIPPGRLNTHPDLKALGILRSAQGTNFKVSPNLDEDLAAFVAAWPPPPYS